MSSASPISDKFIKDESVTASGVIESDSSRDSFSPSVHSKRDDRRRARQSAGPVCFCRTRRPRNFPSGSSALLSEISVARARDEPRQSR